MKLGNSKLLNAIIESIQDVKGHNIVTVDMTGLDERVCDYFVICEGNTNTQVDAITDSVDENVKKSVGEDPFAIQGRENDEWVALDYGDIMVHIFQPEARAFYDLEHLWADADINAIADDY